MAASNVYITKSGDTWDMIAKEVYGSETYTSFLMANNQKHIQYFVFPSGIRLNIKALPSEETNTLPEWRS